MFYLITSEVGPEMGQEAVKNNQQLSYDNKLLLQRGRKLLFVLKLDEVGLKYYINAISLYKVLHIELA